MRRFVFFFASITLMAASAARASDEDSAGSPPADIRPFVGAYVPTGAQHSEMKSSVLAGVQVGYSLPAPVELVGTFAWAPSKAKDFQNTRTSIYQYDAGAEWNGRHPGNTDSWKLSPFIGAGVGARTYGLKNTSTARQTDLDGYGSLGGELASSRLGARLELRDYLSRFKGLEGQEKSSTRNDLMLAGALTFHL